MVATQSMREPRTRQAGGPPRSAQDAQLSPSSLWLQSNVPAALRAKQSMRVPVRLQSGNEPSVRPGSPRAARSARR